MKSLSKYKKIVFLSVICLIGYAPFAHAWGEVVEVGPLLGYSITTALKAAFIATNTLKLFEEAEKSYANLVQNTQRVGSDYWKNPQNIIMHTTDALQKGCSLAVGKNGLSNLFTSIYSASALAKGGNFSANFGKLAGSAMDTFKNSLLSAGVLSKQLASENNTIQQLTSSSFSGITGRMQAAQLGNQLSSNILNQLQYAKQLSFNALSSANSYRAYQVSKEQAQQDALAKFIESCKVPMPEYSDDQGTGDIPRF